MFDFASNDPDNDELRFSEFEMLMGVQNHVLFYPSDDVSPEPVPSVELQPRDWQNFRDSLCLSVLETAVSYQLEAPTISYSAQAAEDEVADASDASDAPDMDGSEYDPNSPKPAPARLPKGRKGKRAPKNPRPRSVNADLGVVSSARKGSPARKERSWPVRRNAEANPEERKAIEKMLAILNKDRSKRVANFTCPVCVFKQFNDRLPDFKRHLKTHIEHDSCCTGVPLEERDNYPIPPDSIPYEIKGVLYIGGCQHSFSRKDALSRHIKNPANSCVGH